MTDERDELERDQCPTPDLDRVSHIRDNLLLAAPRREGERLLGFVIVGVWDTRGGRRTITFTDLEPDADRDEIFSLVLGEVCDIG